MLGCCPAMHESCTKVLPQCTWWVWACVKLGRQSSTLLMKPTCCSSSWPCVCARLSSTARAAVTSGAWPDPKCPCRAPSTSCTGPASPHDTAGLQTEEPGQLGPHPTMPLPALVEPRSSSDRQGRCHACCMIATSSTFQPTRSGAGASSGGRHEG